MVGIELRRAGCRWRVTSSLFREFRIGTATRASQYCWPLQSRSQTRSRCWECRSGADGHQWAHNV